MKKGIHPENYRLVAFKDMSNDVVFLCRSAVSTKETIEVNGTESGNLQGGFRVVVNTGPDGKQDVYHLHIHLMGGKRPWKIPN